VAGYQLLKDGPQTRGLSLVMFTSRHPHLFTPAGRIGFHARLPELAFLVGVFLARAALYHGVEFAFDLFRPSYIYPSTPVRFSHSWTLTLVLPTYLC
jgi:hypothetical protein